MPQPPVDEDQQAYAEEVISVLVDGERWSDLLDRPVPAPGWLNVRAYYEHSGRVDMENFCDVIDIERALAGLERRDHMAAAVVWLRLGGFTYREIAQIMRSRSVARLSEKGQAWMAAFLSGSDPEKAYTAAR